MTLKTKESLQRMFNQSKQKQQRKTERQKRKKQYQREYQKKYRQQDQLLKKSFREEKKKLMDNLYALIKKRSQEVRKPPSYEFKIYRTEFIERDTAEDDLYKTFNELMEAQERGEGKINVENWNNIVQLTKEQINQYERNKA